MKYKLRRTGKRSLALLLGILIMFSTLMIGTITANAATLTNGAYIYFDAADGQNWSGDSATFNINYFVNSAYNKKVSMNKISGTNIWYSKIDIDNVNQIQILRMSSDGSTQWNYSKATNVSDTNNCFYASGWNDTTLSTKQYVPTPSTYSITANKTSVEEGETVTFTPSINTTYTDIKSNSYSVTGGSSSDYTISGNNITFYTAGTYKVTDTITYNAKGFTGITGTVTTASVTITVNLFQPTVTAIDGLTENKAENKIIVNSNTSYKAQSAWIWEENYDGTAHNLTAAGTVDTQYLSYYSHSLTSPCAIFFQGTVTDGNNTFPGNTRITTDDVKPSNGYNTSADGNTSITDGNYYFPVTTATTDVNKFTVFDHIGGTITPDQTSITLGDSITLTGAATAGTLRQSKINAGNDKFTYAVRDSDGNYYRIGSANTAKTSVTWTPTEGGTYTVCGLVTDPFGFESIKVNETKVTVNDPNQAKNLTSTATHCTVKFYSDSALTNEITQAKENETVYVRITPDTNYEFSSVKADGGVTLTSVSSEENVYSFTMPGSDVNVTAVATTIMKVITIVYPSLLQKITVKYCQSGTFRQYDFSDGATITRHVDIGTDITITATLNPGYEAANPAWVISDQTITPATTDTTCSFTVSDEATVTYNIKKIDYSINYVNNPQQGGTSAVKVDGNDVTKLNIDDSFTVETNANTEDGYEVDSLEVKAGDSTLTPDSDGVYTMTTGTVTVTTTYKAIKPAISNLPTDTVTLNAGQNYTILATTDYGTLSYAESTGDFTFNGNVATAPNKEGTYTITVTATNQPTGITTAATTTAEINVIVQFTETQKAYKDLENKFAEIGNEQAEYYENNDAWAAYEAAVESASSLLATFPSCTETNTTDYTGAQTALQNAYNEIQKYRKVNTIYVLSKYAPDDASNKGYVNIYMFNNTSGESYEPAVNAEPVSTSDDGKGKAYAMENLGTVQVDSADKYLYKFEYYGKGDFIVYVGDSSNTEIAENNKLTGNVTSCKGFTSYYLDLKDTSKTTIEKDAEYSGTIVSPYVPLSVKLASASDTCVEDTTYDLTTKIAKTEGGTLKTASGVTVTHTYTDTLNGTTTNITNPATWIPTDPGVHTITITSSNGIANENVTNTFTLYVQDKLDKPVISVNGVKGDLTVNNETNVTITVTSSGDAYPEGVTYVFTVDGIELDQQSEPTLTYNAGALDLGNHTVTVTVIAPDTKIAGTEIKQYADSDAGDTRNVVIETVKYKYTFDFTNCHVTNILTYSFNEVQKTSTELSGTITVDKNSEVYFKITMSDNYEPIPSDNCWSGVNGATIGDDKLSYSFNAVSDNAGSTIVFKSYLPAVLSPDSQDIKIGKTAEITIDKLDSNANYQLQYKKDADEKYVAASSATGNIFTTQSLEYGKYNFRVRQYTDDYEFYSNVVNVNAVIGTVVINYSYKEYDTTNGLAYDPYIGKENNLKTTATEYSISLEEDISIVLNDNGYTEMYKKYAPDINSNYFNYALDTSNVSYELNDDKTVCTISGSVMEASERTYDVSINGEKKFTSYYQQKTFLLDAADYCSGEGTYGYVWYNVDSKGNNIVVSTDQYYKLRVARDTNLYVTALDTEVKTPTTIINEPVYNEYTTAENAIKVQMNMLVENYLPDDAVRTKTGVVYYAYENDATPPVIDEARLADLIAESSTLANANAGTTCTVGTLDGTEIKGYYTANDNVNGKFIFGPIASITSNKTYVVYSYLTYIQDSVATTIVSGSPVTASVKLYKDSITTT